MDIVKVFGENVKKYRIAKDISQEKLAELSGLHRTYISGIECYRRNVSLENVERIAKALDIEAFYLLQEEKTNGR